MKKYYKIKLQSKDDEVITDILKYLPYFDKDVLSKIECNLTFHINSVSRNVSIEILKKDIETMISNRELEPVNKLPPNEVEINLLDKNTILNLRKEEDNILYMIGNLYNILNMTSYEVEFSPVNF